MSATYVRELGTMLAYPCRLEAERVVEIMDAFPHRCGEGQPVPGEVVAECWYSLADKCWKLRGATGQRYDCPMKIGDGNDIA